MSESKDATIIIYLDFGAVYSYTIKNCSPTRAQEHVHAIGTQGYDRVGDGGCMEHYPAHRILKIKTVGLDVKPLYREDDSKVC